MKLAKTSGVTLAVAAAALLLGGAAAPANAQEAAAKIKCWGVNACKGKTACATSANGCAGRNSCKGKGWIKLAPDDCKAQGGATTEKKS